LDFRFEEESFQEDDGRIPVEDFLAQMDKSDRAVANLVRAGLGKLENRLYHRYPNTKEIGDDLYELRAGPIRVLYIYVRGRKIVLLHAFRKKSQATPSRDHMDALRRQRRYEDRERGSGA
jgi:phage-related protein